MMLLSVVLTFALVMQCRSLMPLQHVTALMSPPTQQELRTLASARRFERHVRDSDDVYGGSTIASVRAQYASHAIFARSCEQRPDNCFVLSTDDATVLSVGDVVFGDLCTICDAQDEMSGHLCVARVVAVDDASGDCVRVNKVEDAWRLVESIDIDFLHTPGNRTHAEALAEMRKRGNHLLASVADQSLQFAALDWNYDATSKKAAETIDIPQLSTEFGVKSTCVDCYAHLGTGVEFALRLSLNAYGAPILDAFKLVLFGELALSSRFSTTYPIAAEQSFRFALLDRALSSVPLVIPIGLLAVTIRPYTLVALTATASISVPFALEYGASVSAKLRHGVQLVPGESVQRVQSMESDADVYVKLEKPTLDASVTAGLDLSLVLGVGLTVAAAALLPINPMINVTLSVRPEATLGLVPSDTCALSTAYELKAGLKMAAELSVISLGIGSVHYDLSFNGRLPYRIDVDAVEAQVPEGCALCRGCLPGAAALTNVVMKTVSRVLAPPPLPAVASRTDALAVAVLETGAAVGAPLTIRWRRADDAVSLDIVNVTFAAELRRGTDASVFDAEWVTNEQLDATVPFDLLEFKIAQLGPLGVAIPAGTRVRFVVVAAHSDDLFGRSDWLQLGAPLVAAGAAPVRLFSGWQACSVECGAGGLQTRTTQCVAGDGATQVDNSTCSYAGVLARTCSSLLASCPYVPYKLLEPTTLTADATAMWSPGLVDASVVVEFFGGQIASSTAVWGCPVNADLDPCSSAVRPTTRQCAQLTTVSVNAKGTTRIRVQLGSFVTRGRVLTVFTDPGPVPFVVMLENMSGVREWVLSSPIILRPTIDYALEYTEKFGTGTLVENVHGPISLASPLGTVVLDPARQYKARAKDIGAVTAIAFYGLSGMEPLGPHHDFVIRTTFDNGAINGKSYGISDRRADKSEGWATAICNNVNTGRQCVVCNPGTVCMRPSDALRAFTNLLRSCPQPVENVAAWVAPPGWVPPATWTNGGDGVTGGGSAGPVGSGPPLFTQEGSFFESGSNLTSLSMMIVCLQVVVGLQFLMMARESMNRMC